MTLFPQTSPRALRAWLLGGLLVLLLALRILPCWTVLTGTDGSPRFPDNDPYFHLRQALYCNAHFPQIQRWEDVSRYPERERNDAAGLYDLFLGGTAWLIAGARPSPITVQWVCFLFPPLCMGGVLFVGYRLLRKNAGGALALLLASWLVFAPGDGVLRSTLGFCDHHVVEMLVGVTCILAWVRLLRAEIRTPLPWWRPAWGAALPFTLFHFTWLGGPIYILILALTAWVQVLAETASGNAPSPAARAATRLLGAHVIMAGLAGLLWPELPLNMRYHHGMLAGAVAIMAGLPLYAWLLARTGRRFSPATAAWTSLIATIAIVAGAWLASIQVRWFAAMLLTPKSLLVAEDVPVTWGYYFYLTGLPGMLLLTAPVVMLLTKAWRQPLWLAASVPSWLLVALWAQTRDYGYQAALHAVLAAGPVLAVLGAHMPKLIGKKIIAAFLAIFTLMQIALAWPLRVTAPLWLDPQALLETGFFANDGWIEAAAWWKRQPPPETWAGTAKPNLPRGRIGVLSDWTTGDLVNTLTVWPAVSSRYPEAEGLRPLFSFGEEAVRALPLRGSTVADSVGYVLVEPRLLGGYLPNHLKTLDLDIVDFVKFRSLKTSRGTLPVPVANWRLEGSFASRLLRDDGQGLSHFRLVFESRQEGVLYKLFEPESGSLERPITLISNAKDRARWFSVLAQDSWFEGDSVAYDGQILPLVKVFQQVAGATLVGNARPNASVVATLDLRVNTTGRTFRYQKAVRSDINGLFHLTLPYSNEQTPGSDISPAPTWTLQTGTISHPFSLLEKQVINGDTVSLPESAP